MCHLLNWTGERASVSGRILDGNYCTTDLASRLLEQIYRIRHKANRILGQGCNIAHERGCEGRHWIPSLVFRIINAAFASSHPTIRNQGRLTYQRHLQNELRSPYLLFLKQNGCRSRREQYLWVALHPPHGQLGAGEGTTHLVPR